MQLKLIQRIWILMKQWSEFGNYFVNAHFLGFLSLQFLVDLTLVNQH